jgi:hypothetical protein
LLNLPFSSPTFGSAVAIVALLAWRLIFHVMPAFGMFRSSEAVTTRAPSGEKAALRTAASWPRRIKFSLLDQWRCFCQKPTFAAWVFAKLPSAETCLSLER